MQSVNFQLMSTIFDCLSAHRVKKKKKKKTNELIIESLDLGSSPSSDANCFIQILRMTALRPNDLQA